MYRAYHLIFCLIILRHIPSIKHNLNPLVYVSMGLAQILSKTADPLVYVSMGLAQILSKTVEERGGQL